jgi:nitroimidazol reductase NimA-like FMN-containing flavoprotein (pyridoxamine 5'-phosphate oxidase superfamily)
MADQAKNWEDVKSYTLDSEDERELLDAQTECTLIWAGKEGWPMGVIVNFIYRDGRFWLTASEERPRIASIRKDPRVSIAVTSKGSSVKERRSITYKCTAVVHRDRETLDWVLPEFANAMRPGEPEKAEAFRTMLDSPDRVVLELVPVTRIGFDSAKMWKASEGARPSDSPSAGR